MASANEIVAHARITEVYLRLGGELWHGRGTAFWRRGDGFNVSFDNECCLWHDFTTDEGGGVLDLICRALEVSRQEALRWLADQIGMRLDDKPPSEQWRQEKELLDRNLPDAKQWKRGIVNLTEDLLRSLKLALVDKNLPQPEIGEIYDVEQMLARLKTLKDIGLVKEFLSWKAEMPAYTTGIIHAVRQREYIEQRALKAYVRNGRA